MFELLLRNKELIEIIAGIGTFVSAMIALFTLYEVKKQRLSLYKPDILLKSFIVYISKSPIHKEKEELLEYKTYDFNDYSNNSDKINYETFAKYKVDNVGFGVAKNVVCQWQFDTKAAIKELEKIITKDFRINWLKDLDIYFLEKKYDDDFHYSAYAIIDKQGIDYITPINIQKHFHFHSIPEIILFSHFLYLIFKTNLIEKTGKNFNIFEFSEHKFPSPSITVEFKDTNGKKHTKKYKFKMTAVSVQTEETIDLTKEFAYLNFELI